MLALVCLGDATTHGGRVISASSSIFIDSVQVALVGDAVSCPKHGANKIIEGDPTVFENGISVVVDKCQCECGCRVVSSHTDCLTEA